VTESSNLPDSSISRTGLSREEVLELLQEWLETASALAREQGLTPSASLGLALGVLQHKEQRESERDA
jgi:hypothetical protein